MRHVNHSGVLWAEEYAHEPLALKVNEVYAREGGERFGVVALLRLLRGTGDVVSRARRRVRRPRVGLGYRVQIHENVMHNSGEWNGVSHSV